MERGKKILSQKEELDAVIWIEIYTTTYMLYCIYYRILNGYFTLTNNRKWSITRTRACYLYVSPTRMKYNPQVHKPHTVGYIFVWPFWSTFYLMYCHIWPWTIATQKCLSGSAKFEPSAILQFSASILVKVSTWIFKGKLKWFRL